MVLSAVAWRNGDYFSGGFDVVVVAKAMLAGIALILALVTRRRPEAWAGYRGAPILWLLAYLACSTVGSLLNGAVLASGILTIRLLIMAATVVLLLASFEWETVMSALASAMLTLSIIGAATGIGSMAERGRLYGGIPPLNANDMCMMVSFCVVMVFWRMLESTAGWLDVMAICPMLAIVWLTGSRTGLASLVIALVVVLVMSRRVPTPVFVAATLTAPVAVAVTFFTPVISRFAGRDTTSITTLNSRTVAWKAGLHYAQTASQKLFGSGLSLKEIPVSAQYRTQQIFDSSWISALIQSGYIGFSLLLILVVSTYAKAFGTARDVRGLVVAAVGLIIMFSVMESGTFDTTPAFALFFTLSLYVYRPRRRAVP
jgi:O-antigen ligase